MAAVGNFFTQILGGRGRSGPEEPPAEARASARGAAPGQDWGLEPEHLGAAYDANEIFKGDRARTLDYRGSFFYARLHDRKAYDMNGAPYQQGQSFPGAQGFLAGTPQERYVPLSQRRPHSPYRLSRTIVKAFTGMLFGSNRWPQPRSDDPETQAACLAIEEAANLRNRFVRLRNMGGAQGSCGLSWTFLEGRPVVRVHSGRFCQVLEWEDPDELVPRHVTELYRSRAMRPGEDGRPERYEVWVRRDWTPEADVVFEPVEARDDANPEEWVVDEARSYAHGCGECHFIWVTNFPDDEDPSATDGQPDYAELYEQLETLDGSNSILVKGVTANLDPTLHVKRENPESVKAIRKGSEHAIVTDVNGDAKYLTIPGDVVTTGETLVNMQRAQVLEVAQCVVADPDAVAAAGTSSLTMKLVYAPMIGAADLLREPYGKALVQLYEQMLREWRRAIARGQEGDRPDEEQVREDLEGEPEEEPVELPPDEQEPVQVDFYLDLPDRVVTEEVVGPDGAPTGEVRKSKAPQQPGRGKVTLEWGDYFPPTADDRQKNISTLSTASGGKAVVSQRTAVEVTSAMLNKDPTEEWQRVTDEASRAEPEVPGAGGEVAADGELPPGA